LRTRSRQIAPVAVAEDEVARCLSLTLLRQLIEHELGYRHRSRLAALGRPKRIVDPELDSVLGHRDPPPQEFEMAFCVALTDAGCTKVTLPELLRSEAPIQN
jgi:hypothetical protein